MYVWEQDEEEAPPLMKRVSPIASAYEEDLRKIQAMSTQIQEQPKAAALTFQPRSPFTPFRISVWQLAVTTASVQRDLQTYAQWWYARMQEVQAQMQEAQAQKRQEKE